jgi:hypothetical protein
MSSGPFELAFTHRAHDSEPRGELQAESLRRSEIYLSDQSERRAIRVQLSCERQGGRPSYQFRSPLSCLSHLSPLTLIPEVVL